MQTPDYSYDFPPSSSEIVERWEEWSDVRLCIKNRNEVPLPQATLNIGWMVNFQHSGLANYLMHDRLPREALDSVKDRTPEALRESLKRFSRKMIKYYGREYVLDLALAGPMFWNVLFGNFLTEKIRDVYTALSLHCGRSSLPTACARSRPR